VNLFNSTITGITRGIAASYKDNATVGNILFQVTNCIVRSSDAVYTDFGATNFNIGYCNLSEPWPGVGNFTLDPMFVDSVTNYHLQLASPCLDAGEPTAPSDPDGTPLDVGAYSFTQDTVLPIGPVVIHEIMYHPVNSPGGPEVEQDEFVELYNSSGSSVPLYSPAFPTNTWRVDGGIKFTFPSNCTLPAYHSLLLVGFDPATDTSSLNAFRDKYGVSTAVTIFGPFTGRLDNVMDTIVLFEPGILQASDGSVLHAPLDRVTYSNATPWPSAADGSGESLQRQATPGYGNWPTNWFSAPTTAGSANTGDSDGDSLPDRWEMAQTLDAFDPNGDEGATGDPDHDGFDNLQEYLAGTHPKDDEDYLRIASVAPVAGGLALRFMAAEGRSYSVLYREQLSAGRWQKLADAPAVTNSTLVEIIDPDSNNRASCFYRLVAPSWIDP